VTHLSLFCSHVSSHYFSYGYVRQVSVFARDSVAMKICTHALVSSTGQSLPVKFYV
jgi:hypothetical protein